MKIRTPTPEREAIRQRQARLEGNETIRGQLFQAITICVTALAGPAAAEAVAKESGLSGTSFDAMSKYPLASFLRYEEAAATRIAEATGSFDDAVHRIGAQAVETFFDSLAGRTMALLAGKDPTRLLTTVPNGYELLVNYGKRRWKRGGPNEGVFSFEGELLGPVHSCGIFDTALRIAHGVDAKIELQSRGPVDFDFHISW